MMYSNKMVAAIRCNGKVLRESKETVHIPFGSEYSVRLKNLSTQKASVSISIDGEDVLDGHTIIVTPGNTTDIERFISDGDLSSGRKFKFIEKTKEISDFRGNEMEDGLVEISYRFERPYYGSIFPLPAVKHFAQPYNDHVLRSADQAFYTASINNVGVIDNSIQCSAMGSNVAEPQNDAGITVKGSESDQSFSEGYIGCLEATTHKMIIQLKGTDKKGEIVKAPVLVKTKKQCPSCGKRWSSKYEYCPDDGTFLE